jgi:hypothetical protein
VVYTHRNDDFDWDDANAGHIARHSVSPEESEEALLDPRRFAQQARRSEAEHRSAVLGATSSGRILFVVYTKRGDRIRVITVRDATERERQRYRRGRKR